MYCVYDGGLRDYDKGSDRVYREEKVKRFLIGDGFSRMEITILLMAGSWEAVFEGIVTGFANRGMVTGNRDGNFGLYDDDTASKER